MRLFFCCAAVVCQVLTAGPANAQEEPPLEWVDPATGHRVVRLSREPGSQSLYFHEYPYSADGIKLVFTTRRGISAVNLQTRQIEQVVEGRARVLVTGRKTGDVYFMRGNTVYAADLDTRESREVATLPARYGRGNVTVNADETRIVALGRDPDGEARPRTPPPGHSVDSRITGNWAAGRPMLLYTVDVASGEVQILHRSNDWLNHLQCSPTDPRQIMFCHEGPWHFVDRIWIIRADGSGLTSVHPRTMDMEIAGHEFFSQDGQAVWYDLQTPRSLVFWLARYDIATGKRNWYHVEREHWSVHFNISPDGTMMAGDGGGPASVANMDASGRRFDPPRNGQWIYLFRPERIGLKGLPERAAEQVEAGVLRAERLVDLSQHDYRLEPNVTFTPDGKWIVFRSNMHGPTHVYAVEVAKAKEATARSHAERGNEEAANEEKIDEFREVSFETADGGRVFANLYGTGEHAVVLAHGAVFNKESWHELAQRLVKEKHRVLAIDFRGYGKSEAGSAGRALELDVLAAIQFLRESGAKRVSVLGGSMGGGAAATAATKLKEGQIDRLILLAAVPIEEPERIQGNKLFIVSRGDRLRPRVEQQFEAAKDPKKLIILAGDAHAQHIFKTDQADELTKLIVDWLAEKKDSEEAE